MRALSPAINDPNTGIHCINALSALAAKLSTITGKYSALTIQYDSGKEGKLISKEFDFETDLYLMFYQLANYAKSDPALVLSMLHALAGVLPLALEENKKYIKAMADYIYEISIGNFSHPIDISQIKKQMELLK